jgi:Protein of unknown function (DUF4054)
MAVTVASFRKDFPTVFGSQSAYPDEVINYWISMAALLLGTGSGSPPLVCSFKGSISQNILTVLEQFVGFISILPLVLQGEDISPSATILAQLTGDPGQTGTYKLNINTTLAAEPMVAVSNAPSSGGNPFWGPSSSVASSPPTTIADFATEMWVAHQIVLDKQAAAAAATGGDPGTKIGIVSSKSVNGVSVGFDVGATTGGVMQADAGYYNQTIYGQRFYRLMRIRGSGPIQLGIGQAPPFLFFNSCGPLGSGNAWAGPYPGIEQGDTGFSS